MDEPIVCHDLPFAAPIAAGNTVLVATVRRSESDVATTKLALDVSSRVLYCGDALLGPLGAQLLATTDPLAVLTRWSWKVVATSTGRVAGAIVSTTSAGEHHAVVTRLFVERLEDQPYRG